MKQLAKTMMIVLAGAFLCTSLSGCWESKEEKEKKALAESIKAGNEYQRKLRESASKLDKI